MQWMDWTNGRTMPKLNIPLTLSGDKKSAGYETPNVTMKLIPYEKFII